MCCILDISFACDIFIWAWYTGVSATRIVCRPLLVYFSVNIFGDAWWTTQNFHQDTHIISQCSTVKTRRCKKNSKYDLWLQGILAKMFTENYSIIPYHACEEFALQVDWIHTEYIIDELHNCNCYHLTIGADGSPFMNTTSFLSFTNYINVKSGTCVYRPCVC